MSRLDSVRDLARLLLGHAGRFRGRDLQDVATRALRDPAGRRGWVVSTLNASLRVRRFLRYALRLEPRRLWTRLARDHRHAGPRYAFSLLCPTRGRVRQAARFLRSISRTAVDGSRVEVVFYVDNDDPALPAYRDLFARPWPRIGRCALLVGDPIGVPAAWNRLAAASSGDLLLMANDDQLYVDHGWDVALDAQVEKLRPQCPNGVFCLYFDAGQYPAGGRDFPMVSRRWYEALGYFVPTIFSQWEVETWVFDVAERLGRLFVVPGVFVEHLHYQDYKAPFDATYQRHRMTREKSFTDHALFLRTVALREAEVATLRAVTEPGAPAEVDQWFTGYLADHRLPAQSEVDAWLAGTRPAAGRRAVLFEGGAWTPEASRSFPVVRDVLLAIPEATLAPDSVVEVVVLDPDAAAARPGAGAVRVYWGVRVPDGAVTVTAGRDEPWRPGDCRVTGGAAAPVVRAPDGRPVVAVRFAVPKAVPAPAPVAATGEVRSHA